MHDFESILIAAQAGAEWAWTRLYDEFYRAVVGYFRGQGARDPEDLASDVFLRMSRTITNFEGSDVKFRSWVFTIAHNRLIDERRSRTRRPENLEWEPPEQVAPHVTDELVLAGMGTEWVLEALELLSPEQREVLTLRIVGGLTIPEIADVVARRVGAVKQLQRRAIRRLAKHLGDNPYPFGREERSHD